MIARSHTCVAQRTFFIFSSSYENLHGSVHAPGLFASLMQPKGSLSCLLRAARTSAALRYATSHSDTLLAIALRDPHTAPCKLMQPRVVLLARHTGFQRDGVHRHSAFDGDCSRRLRQGLVHADAKTGGLANASRFRGPAIL